MNIIDAINDAEKQLANAGVETPRLDAEVLLANTLNTTRSDLYVSRHKDVPADLKNRFAQAIIERANGCPVAYITGQKEFWSLPIRVTPNVMVPRPETETVVEEVLRIAGARSHELNILDLCTGSGCIAVALATELPKAHITATDISQEALDVAHSNLLFAKNRIMLCKGDLFEALTQDGKYQPCFDIIVTNPPYVPETDREKIPREIANFEPKCAIFGGQTGLDFIWRIIKDAHRFLSPKGWLVMEVGKGQAVSCTKAAITTKAYDSIRTTHDLAGIERVVSMRGKWRR